uniref:Sulfotransferase domain-containing protein n=2 Tax=Arion vulgaris TaxID=1028688 RepID=A0A0B6YX13_9EUPU
MKQHKGSIISDDHGSLVYRKGKVGDWKNFFTVAQSEWFDHIIRTRMGKTELFKFRYSL